MERKYKNYTITKQVVGPRGWNVSTPDGSCTRGMTGFRSIAAAKEFINNEIDMAEVLNDAR